MMNKRFFTWNKITKHPCYILREHKGCFDYISITHSPSTKGRINIPLSSPINKDDPNRNFIVLNVLVDHKENFELKHNKLIKYRRMYKFNKRDGYLIRDIEKFVKEYYDNRFKGRYHK